MTRARHRIFVVFVVLGPLALAAALIALPIMGRERELHWRDVSFDEALSHLRALAPVPLDLSPSTGQAVQRKGEGQGLETVIRFAASEDDVFALAEAFRMERSHFRPPVNAYDLVGSRSYAIRYGPSWFKDIMASDDQEVAAVGGVEGFYYELAFLCAREGSDGMTMYLRLYAMPQAYEQTPSTALRGGEFYATFEKTENTAAQN